MKRASGILMHVSSLNGEYSIGSFGKEAKAFVDFLSESGFTYWQVLPFCLPDNCNSPYKSFGAFSLNYNFIDLPTLFEKGLISKSNLDSAKQQNPYLCEFDRLNSERLEILKIAFKNFKDYKGLDKFYKTHKEIEKFCSFMALKHLNDNKPHNLWDKFDVSSEVLNFYKFLEYETYIEWLEIKNYANAKNVKIIGDMPIYVDYDSADLYYNKDNFLLDENGDMSLVAGVPPDYFSKDGQLWGNPLYNFEKMKEDGYSWWLNRIDHYKELFDGVRIDHFRAFQDFYAVKNGENTAKNGKWKKGPRYPFIKLLKERAKDFLIIAEDLGVITNEVKALVEKSTFPGMKVLQFGFDEDNSEHLPHNYKNNLIAYTGTHDNNTLLGYIWDLSEEKRNMVMDYFQIDRDKWNNSYDKIIYKMLSSTAGIVIFPIQDILKYGSDTRMNTPGVAKNNWAFRITSDYLSKIDKTELKYQNKLFSRN